MRTAKALLFVSLAIAIASIPIFSQSPRPSFEVVSIKPNTSGSGNSLSGTRPGGYYFANNTSVRFLIMQAYRVQSFQIEGGPSWINSDAFDVEARAEAGTVPQAAGPPDPNRPDATALMIQSLLEERFQLKLHRESRPLPVYNLVVVKDASKLQPAADGRPGPGGLPPGNSRISGSTTGSQMTASAINMATFANVLAQQLRRPVIDKTNLSGSFDITLKWVPDVRSVPLTGPGGAELPPPDPDGTSIFTAIQEQLGLKLESAKGPVDVLIIDSVQKPSEN